MPIGVYQHKPTQGFQKGHPDWGNKKRKELGIKPPSQKGKKRSKETIKKLSEAHKDIFLKEKSPLWLGGKSYEPYTLDWTETLRTSIRERDKYICQICEKKQGDYAFSVHHIDYDKKNCNPNNLITLCKSCHTKTNINRKYWIDYFYYYWNTEAEDFIKLCIDLGIGYVDSRLSNPNVDYEND